MSIIAGFISRQPVVLWLLLPLGLFCWEFLPAAGQADDAYISYRYAQNLADGYGLVFNRGERVEGYTNLLWTLLIALGIKVGVSAPQAGHLLSFATGLLCLMGTYQFAAALIPRARQVFAVLAPLVLLSSNAFASWTASGLETPMFTAWVIWAFVSFQARRIWWVLLFCVLAALTRPDGLLLAFVLFGADWLMRIYEDRPRSLAHWVKISIPGMCFASVVALHTAVRLAYYGDWVPNTFRAKVGGVPVARGFEYAYNFLADGHVFLIVGALVAGLVISRYRVAVLFSVLVATYIVSIGGDVFQFGRFWLPCLPLFIGGALAAVFIALERNNRVGAVLLAGMFVLCPLWCLYAYWPVTSDNAGVTRLGFPESGKRAAAYRNHVAFGDDGYAKAQADRILSQEPAVQLVAAVGLGRLGYFLGAVPVLDLVGLVDRHIARSERRVQGEVLILPGHQRTDADYVFARNPDLIFIPRKEEAWLALPATRDLWGDPRFEQRYEWDFDLQVYKRRSDMGR